MKLVVMIPAYNEEKTVGSVIRDIPDKIPGVEFVESLVIDDGSTDKTARVAEQAGAHKILFHETNLGLGVSFREGINYALDMGADIIVNIDADEQFDPKDISRLIEPILKGKADFVTASRFLDKDAGFRMPWIKKIGNRIFTRIVSRLTNRELTDTQCGFRAYSREAALRLNIFGDFTYTQEIFLDLANKGLSVKEIPVRVRERQGKSKVVTHWYIYGFNVLIIIIRTFRDYKPLTFFGSIGLAIFLPGIATGLFMLIRWFIIGRTSPYTSLLYITVIMLILGIIFIVLALIADMIGRQRKIEEEILYWNKLRRYTNMNRKGKNSRKKVEKTMTGLKDEQE